MSFQPQLIVPLISAAVYGVAAIFLKRATAIGGAGAWRVAFVTNLVQALLFAPLWFVHSGPFTWQYLGESALAGSAFFVGQVFAFLALSRGDVSVATPVLGTKVIFVALLTVVLAHQSIPGVWWLAAALAAAATALMGGGKTSRADGSFTRSLIYGFSAALAFSTTDVLTQMWAKGWGPAHFAPAMFLTVAVLSFALIPLFPAPLRELPAEAWRWLIPGAVLVSTQAAGIAYSIMNFGKATQVNILYSSRGVWSVVIVWSIGHWFGNEERGRGHGVMARRLCGSLMLLCAILLVILNRNS